jgi:hypothetical protein
VRTTAPNPARRRRLVEVVTTSEVKLPAWVHDRPKPRKCVICETQFPARGRWKTCTPECSRAYKLAQLRQQSRKHYAANSEKLREYRRRRRLPIIRECAVCGKKFDSRKGTKTCSSECSREYKLASGRRHYATNSEKILARRRRPPKIKQCVICGKTFVVTGKRASKVNACSPTCQHERTLMRLRAWRARNHIPKIREI